MIFSVISSSYAQSTAEAPKTQTHVSLSLWFQHPLFSTHMHIRSVKNPLKPHNHTFNLLLTLFKIIIWKDATTVQNGRITSTVSNDTNCSNDNHE